MRTALALIAVLLLLATAASAQTSADFGLPGEATFDEFVVPIDGDTPEPTVGIPWNTDSVFYHSGSTTLRARFSDAGEPDWVDVTPPYQVPINLDPMLHADSDSGRIWAGGLHGLCSVMMMSDDDGETWTPSGNMCSGQNFDHQSIGSGPSVGVNVEPGYGYTAYYCAQGGGISCAFSVDGGRAWGPFQEAPGPCGGFHGHIRTSPLTGFVAVPVASCGDHNGYITSSDGGITWLSNAIEASDEWTNGFDPSLQFTRQTGWMYYGMATEKGAYIGLSKDQGATWEPIGGGMGVDPSVWLDVGQFHDPPVVAGVFADVQAGDDERVAFSFIGLEAGPGADLDYLRSNEIYSCHERQDELVWHYYVAFSYDAGDTWTVTKFSKDPVQVGGIFDVLVDSSGCRNLLDFNDMDIDSMGRVYVGWADGCIRACADSSRPESDGYRQAQGKLSRQTSGLGLFSAYDEPAAPTNESTPPPSETSQESTPGPGPLIVAVALFMVVVGRRHR